jgi:hypothetical protein
MRLTYENYDFLYRLAKREDISIAKALNLVIEEKSGSTNCFPTGENGRVDPNGRRHSYAQRYGSSRPEAGI